MQNFNYQMSAAVVTGFRLTVSGAKNSGFPSMASNWFPAWMYRANRKSTSLMSRWLEVSTIFAGYLRKQILKGFLGNYSRHTHLDGHVYDVVTVYVMQSL